MQSSGLNVFQRVTRQWDQLHPYNAAQAMQLAGAAGKEKLKSTWDATLDKLNFGKNASDELIVGKSLEELKHQKSFHPGLLRDQRPKESGA